MSFPVSKPLFNGHAPGIEIHDLLRGQRDLWGDQKIPSLLIAFAPKDNQVQRDLLLGMVENGIALDDAGFGRKPGQSLCLALVINEDILFGSDQKRDAFLKKMPQQTYSRIAAVHDEKGSTLHGKAAHDGHDQGMLQNVLALLDHPIREARKSHG